MNVLFVLALLIVTVVVNAHGHHHQGNVLCKRCGNAITTLKQLVEPLPPHLGTKRHHDVNVSGGINVTVAVTNDFQQDFDLAVFSTIVSKSTSTARNVDNSFFPGTAWHNVECPICGSFIGWGFDRIAHHNKQCTSSKLTAAQALQRDFKANKCVQRAISGGYWTVEYCLNERVVQFHSAIKDGPRDPEYSLGEFHSQEENDNPVLSSVLGTLGQRKALEQVFTGGQLCDETNKARFTKVTLVCCDKGSSSSNNVGKPFIGSFREPNVCQYEMLVCVPSLCLLDGYNFNKRPQEDMETCEDIPPEHVGEEEKETAIPKRFFALDLINGVISEASSDLLWVQNLQPAVGAM